MQWKSFASFLKGSLWCITPDARSTFSETDIGRDDQQNNQNVPHADRAEIKLGDISVQKNKMKRSQQGQKQRNLKEAYNKRGFSCDLPAKYYPRPTGSTWEIGQEPVLPMWCGRK